jgi:Flp pilus assembly protein TadD
MTRLVTLLVLLAAAPAWAIHKGEIVVIKSNADLKRSGQVVGKVKTGEVLRVRAVRGAWVEVGEKTPGWVRVTNVSSQDEAISHMNQLIEERPSDATLRLTRARMHLAQDQLEAAETDIEQASRLDPASADAHYYRGLLNIKRQRPLDAIEQFSEAIRLKDDDARYYGQRARIYRERGNIEGAAQDYEKIIALGEADALTYNNLAWWYATNTDASGRDGAKAVKYATQACELTHFDNWMYLDTLAAAYAEANDFTNAIKYQEQAEQKCDDELHKLEIEARLKQYRLNQPYRETPK